MQHVHRQITTMTCENNDILEMNHVQFIRHLWSLHCITIDMTKDINGKRILPFFVHSWTTLITLGIITLIVLPLELIAKDMNSYMTYIQSARERWRCEYATHEDDTACGGIGADCLTIHDNQDVMKILQKIRTISALRPSLAYMCTKVA